MFDWSERRRAGGVAVLEVNVLERSVPAEVTATDPNHSGPKTGRFSWDNEGCGDSDQKNGFKAPNHIAERTASRDVARGFYIKGG